MNRLLAALPVALAVLPSGLAAQDIAAPPAAATRTALEIRADEVAALVNGKAEPAAIFTARFRAAVSDAQLRTLIAGLVAQFGPALGASVDPRDGTRGSLEIRLERGIAKGSIGIAPAEDNRVSELLISSAEPLAVAGDTPQAIAAELAALPGTVNVWFGPLGGGTPLLARDPERPLAIGSAFKLYVLAALAEDVKAGRRKWSDVVPLGVESYPSGQLQDWPQGAPVTLHSLASLMIAISDNTATDQLIATLGKDRILAAVRDSGHADPTRNTPFLTTRELFVLKAGGEPRIAGWRESDAERRTAILAGLADESRTLDEVNAAFAQGPRALDIEWFASPADLARLFAFMRRTGDTQAFDILAINAQASAAMKAQWRYAGFKGGSEPGVINLTWLLTDEAGRDWMMSLGWNDEASVVDEGKALALARRIMLLPR